MDGLSVPSGSVPAGSSEEQFGETLLAGVPLPTSLQMKNALSVAMKDLAALILRQSCSLDESDR
ncbi:hypothetical protein, partial [Pseudomonas sp.]|uniref:hypothetical protein n=1 Tax=Pseudomonas sp. TaxID=306 RepID=UPI0025F85708